MIASPEVTIVIPTLGRPGLSRLLSSLPDLAPRLASVILVDDRPDPRPPLDLPHRLPGVVLRSGGRGPAAARNVGWRAARSAWIAFLDDDVVCPAGWWEALLKDLQPLAEEVGGSQGRIHVPLPAGRRPTDWERQVRGLERARWATAEMAYRRGALEAVGGFDERFPRAYREDADLAARVRATGWRLVHGERSIEHPVPPAGPLASVRRQAGNQDDAYLLAKYGREWRARLEIPSGSRPRHLLTAALGAVALAGLVGRHYRIATAAGVAWGALTTTFAAERIAPGPGRGAEVATMLLTSLAIPPAATLHWLLGACRHLVADRPLAVLFDRDGTLIEDVPYNGDPALVRPQPGARRVCEELRRRGILTGVVSNQSGIGRGLLSIEQTRRVNERVDELLGPFAVWAVCPHAPEAGCGCRKPRPGLVLDCAARLGVQSTRVVVVGDIGSDVGAAAAAGTRSVLVPTSATRREEIDTAPLVARDLPHAMSLLYGGAW